MSVCWGYYVGFRLMLRLGKTMSLSQIDHLDNKTARPLVMRELDAMIAKAGSCPS